MIKLFRHIRQNLLNEGKTTKYFKYAIGEIILVVIGILIALSINNWNEDRKVNQEEKSYLNRLLQENEEDILGFTTEIERIEKSILIITNFSNAFKNKSSSDSLLVSSANDYIIYATEYPHFDPSTSTFEDLSSTGNLNVIKDIKLRDQIVGHYKDYQAVAWGFKTNADWIIPMDVPLFTNTDAYKFDTTSFLFTAESTENLAKELRKEQAIYQRNISNHYFMNKEGLVHLKQIKGGTITLVDLLENAIKKKD